METIFERKKKLWLLFFFYLDFLSRPFKNNRTAGEGREHFFNSSLQLPPASQTDISRAITAESYLLHIASSRTRTGNIWFPSESSLITKLRALCFLSSKQLLLVL